MVKATSGLILAVAVSGTAFADGLDYPQSYYRHYLPPERHVVEVVQPPWSGNFIINGARFTGVSPACLTWAAGERIKLIEGDWDGRCTVAVFYNFYRHSTCEMTCRGSIYNRGTRGDGGDAGPGPKFAGYPDRTGRDVHPPDLCADLPRSQLQRD
jgi:hypothetical protein